MCPGIKDGADSKGVDLQSPVEDETRTMFRLSRWRGYFLTPEGLHRHVLDGNTLRGARLERLAKCLCHVSVVEVSCFMD